eukprot:PhF_6_TR24079/c0_g1_i1/m.33652
MYNAMDTLGAPWDVGLCDCLAEPLLCCQAMTCPGCIIAYQRSVLNFASCSIVDAMIMCVLLPCCNSVVRAEVRTKYGIQGTPLEDAALSWCCTWCAITQQHRTLTLRGDKPDSLC